MQIIIGAKIKSMMYMLKGSTYLFEFVDMIYSKKIYKHKNFKKNKP